MMQYAVRDIFEKTISRAKAAFMVAHKAGTREEIVEDDDVSIDEVSLSLHWAQSLD